MNILIAGGSGFIGQALSAYLKQQGHTVSILTRQSQPLSGVCDAWIKWNGQCIDYKKPLDAVINLSGENIGTKRWTASRQQALIDSRLLSTKAWQDYFAHHRNTLYKNRMPLFFNASAVGIYASHDAVQDEEHHFPIQNACFTPLLVSAWEEQALAIKKLGVQVSCLRFGVVLGLEGGLLKKLLPSFRYGLGTILGSGSEYLSWIHQEDLCRAVLHLIQQPHLEDVYNLTAPKPCTQRQWAQSLAKACHRPRFLKLPPRLIKALFGKMGVEVMLANLNIHPTYLQKSGFVFHYPEIDTALWHLLDQR